jgi:NAD(P)-dependent dehydrogenase (short-subunit alcohol dehydrogenase family)
MSQTSEPVATDSLRGRRALVAGGYGEIGSVISTLLAERGVDVAIAGLERDPAVKLAEQLATESNRTVGYQVNVTDREAVDQLVEDVTGAIGGIDILINCTGVLKVAPAEDFTEADWRTVIETNLMGAFWLSQSVGRLMIKSGEGGRIVHLSSVRGSVGLAMGGFTAYGASKAGVHLLTKQLAAEWGRHQISVNSVAAGFVRTKLSANAIQDEGLNQMVAARTPLGRVADVQEIANAALYLATEQSSFITGQVLYVDGGLTATQ